MGVLDGKWYVKWYVDGKLVAGVFCPTKTAAIQTARNVLTGTDGLDGIAIEKVRAAQPVAK